MPIAVAERRKLLHIYLWRRNGRRAVLIFIWLTSAVTSTIFFAVAPVIVASAHHQRHQRQWQTAEAVG